MNNAPNKFILPDMFAPPQPPVLAESSYDPVSGTVNERYEAPVDSYHPNYGSDDETVGLDQPALRQGIGSAPGYGYEQPEAKPIRRSCI